MTVYDDYAHHPAEVEATLAALRELHPEARVLVLFQPHLYSRTRHLADELAAALSHADAVCLTEIYAAREEPVPGVTGRWSSRRYHAGGRGCGSAGRPSSRRQDG